MNNSDKSDLQKYESLVDAALALKEAGEHQKAIEILQGAIQQYSLQPSAYLLLAIIYQAESDFEAAEVNYRKALELDGENPDVLQGMGLFLVSRKRYAEAVPYLEKHLEKIPDDENSLDGIVKALNKLGDRKRELIRHVDAAWAHNKKPTIGLRYARQLMNMKEPQKAYDILHEIINEERSFEVLSTLALASQELNQTDQAFFYLEEAVALEPENAYVWMVLASALIKSEKYEKALEAIERAIFLKPQDPMNWWLKSMILFLQNQFELCAESAHHTIDLIKKSEIESEEKNEFISFVAIIRFSALISNKKYLQAIKEFKHIREKENILGISAFSLARSLIKKGQKDLAVKVVFPLPKDDPASLANKYDVFLRGLNDPEKAMELVRSSLENGTEREIQDVVQLGIEEYLHGFRQSAISIYQELMDHYPDNLQVCNNYGYMLIGESQLEEAEAILNKIAIQEDETNFHLIAKCNLAYLKILEKHYEKAAKWIDLVLDSKYSDQKAYLRVPFWLEGQIHPDPAEFPGRDISYKTAALGCMIAASLAEGDVPKAENLFKELSNEETVGPLNSVIHGCLEAAKSNAPKAVEMWNQAIEKSKNEEEKNRIKEWIDLIQNKKRKENDSESLES